MSFLGSCSAMACDYIHACKQCLKGMSVAFELYIIDLPSCYWQVH
jgi:hypothetical protein